MIFISLSCHEKPYDNKEFSQNSKPQFDPHKKVSWDLTKKKQDLTEMSVILMVLTKI